MSAMYGADVAQLRTLAGQFDRLASQLDSDRMSVGNAIQISAWAGPVAVRFRHTWDSDYSRRVHGAAERLRSAAHSLRSNADDQERTSAASGGSSSGATGQQKSHSSLEDKWDSMTAEQKRGLPLSQLTDVYGYAPSLSGRMRDEANRIALERYLDMRPPAGKVELEAYQRMMSAAHQVQRALKEHPDAQLLAFDPTGGSSVHVILSLGDVDHADNVAVYAQGWTSGADHDNGLTNPVNEMAALRAKTGGNTATVVWMDYDAPQSEGGWIVNAQQSPYAEAGARNLTAFVDGIRSNNPAAHVTGLGHSYGSYVTGLAAQQTTAFDSLVVFGSPGLGTSNLSDLNVGGNLYVVDQAGDPVAASAQFGKRPTDIPGAHRIETGKSFENPLGGAHSNYLVDGSMSQRGIADVIAGRS